MTSPLTRYQQDLQREEFVEDPAQWQAVAKLDALFHSLRASERAQRETPPLVRWWRAWRGSIAEPQRGLYLTLNVRGHRASDSFLL